MPGDRSSPLIQRVRCASGNELDTLIHEGDAGVLPALLENPNLQEAQLSRLLERPDLSAGLLERVANEVKWSSSEGIRIRLAQHPHTPRRVALAMLRELFLFDLVRVSMLPSAPADIRRAAEKVMVTRLPHLPIGEKLTLARRGPARVASAVAAEGHPQAIKLALANSFLTESQVLKILANAELPARVAVAIAQHPKWSVQYNVRVALVRHPHTPVPALLKFLPDVTLRDLREVEGLEQLAVHSRKYVQQELARRARDVK